MKRRGFLFAIPALAIFKPKSLAQRLGEQVKKYREWIDIKYRIIPPRPPTKSTWDLMSQEERDRLHLPTFEQWKSAAERWQGFMRRVGDDRRAFVKRAAL